MGLLIQTVVLSCNISQFRARMQRLDNRLGARSWVSTKGVRLVFGEFPYIKWSYASIQTDSFVPMGMFTWKDDSEEITEHLSGIKRPSTRASWMVVPWSSTSMRPWYHPQKGVYYAGLEVYEETDKQIRVDFLDGYNPENPKMEVLSIEVPFEEFTNMLLEELKDVARDVSEGDARKNEPFQTIPTTDLLDILSHRFNEEELRTFCFRLGVDYENLGGSGKESKARELILYFQRREEVKLLVDVGKQCRSELDWPIL